ISNTATASGSNFDGVALSDATSNTVTVDIMHDVGTLSIVKSSDVSMVAHGGTVTYSFAVTYSSADGAPATSVSVSDSICDATPVLVSGDSDGDGRLDVTETWTFQCTHVVPAHSDVEPDPISNTATASGSNFDGVALSDATSNTVTVDIVHDVGTLAIVKSS